MSKYGWVFTGPDGEWHWSEEYDNHESCDDHRPASAAEMAISLRLRAEIKKLKREVGDKQYMLNEIIPMLGEKGQKVVANWDAKGVTRIHVSWGPDGVKTRGEDRAQLHLDLEEAIKNSRPLTEEELKEF